MCVQAYDCPVNRHVFAYAALTSGASLRAAECLLKGEGRVAVNWCGGWHHAKRLPFFITIRDFTEFARSNAVYVRDHNSFHRILLLNMQA